MDIDTSSRKEQRNFGLAMAAVIVAFTLVHGWLHGALALWPFYVALAFFILGLVAPRVLRPVFAVWMKFAEVLNWVMTRLVLSIVFFLMITPTRLFIKYFGKDPLKRAWDSKADTYWEEPERQPEELEEYRRQF